VLGHQDVHQRPDLLDLPPEVRLLNGQRVGEVRPLVVRPRAVLEQVVVVEERREVPRAEAVGEFAGEQVALLVVERHADAVADQVPQDDERPDREWDRVARRLHREPSSLWDTAPACRPESRPAVGRAAVPRYALPFRGRGFGPARPSAAATASSAAARAQPVGQRCASPAPRAAPSVARRIAASAPRTVAPAAECSRWPVW
jgi:hypothetical protein